MKGDRYVRYMRTRNTVYYAAMIYSWQLLSSKFLYDGEKTNSICGLNAHDQYGHKL